MLRSLRTRRRPCYGAQVCAFIAALLLLLSVSILHSRLGSERRSHHHHQVRHSNDVNSVADTFLGDTDDRIGVVQDESDKSKVSNGEEIFDEVDSENAENDQSRVSGYYFDHAGGVIRRALDKRSIDQWDDYASFDANLFSEDPSKVAFGSDDVPIDENVRRKVGEVKGIEDALLLKMGSKVSPLREGWGPWFEAKSVFLRRDRMFKSTFELLNPLNNPLLQDPDGIGVTGLTRGDRLVQKGWLNEFKKVPFLVKKPLGLTEPNSKLNLKSNSKAELGKNVVQDVIKKSGSNSNFKTKGFVSTKVERSEMKKADPRTLDDYASKRLHGKRIVDANEVSNKNTTANLSFKGSRTEGIHQKTGESDAKVVSSSWGQENSLKNVESNAQIRSELSGQVYADGKRWGYFPGLHPHLSFLNFMDAFFRKGKCIMRVFMIWNSPPWMFTIRHQRGLESLLFHHRDACVVILSETIELNFFKGFVKDGFKVAVAMPNLDELLRDTPAHIFASVWFDWRKTNFYSTHSSELLRLAALYKYGGFYLDSDIIVLKPLSSLNNTVGLEGQPDGSSLNGAVMSFRKSSPFLMECLKEYYSTYDDTRLRWNGADLLTRVSRNFLQKDGISNNHIELKLQPSFIFFPVSHNSIARYFAAPATQSERAEQDKLFKRILEESFTFHFWNSLTSALIPEPQSLVARLIDHHCIRCSDVL